MQAQLESGAPSLFRSMEMIGSVPPGEPAPSNPSEPCVLQELLTLQCPPDRVPFPESRGLVQPEPITVEVLRACVNSMKLDAAGGPSGWLVLLIKVAMRLQLFVEFLLGGAVTTDFLSSNSALLARHK